eukprot:5915309-Amphidinium_carterae.1
MHSSAPWLGRQQARPAALLCGRSRPDYGRWGKGELIRRNSRTSAKEALCSATWSTHGFELTL